MDAHKLWMLRDFIGTNKVLFRIPVYQRNYDWSEANCDRLLDDIYEIINSGDKHFLGTIVFMAAKSGGFTLQEYTIIDGQQRLTTMMLILKALAVVAETGGDTCFQEIDEQYLHNKYCDEKYKVKLKPIKSDNNQFLLLLANKTDEMDEDTHIFQNYRLCKERFERWAENGICPSQVLDALTKLEVVEIVLTKGEDDPQVIFESINSTGLDLSNADLIRNFLLMNVDDQERLYEDYWLIIEKTLRNKILAYLLRRLVCGVPSNTLRGLFIYLYNRIFKVTANKRKYYESLNKFLCTVSSKDAVPSENEFERALLTANIYGNNALCRFLLLDIENGDNKETLQVENLTIEHIMPQTLSADWSYIDPEKHEEYLHTLGNLSVTGYNSELSNKSFKEKQEIIRENSKAVVLNRDVLEADIWDIPQIQARAKRLANIVANRYAIDRITDDSIEFEYVETITLDHYDEVTGKKLVSFKLFGETYRQNKYALMLLDVIKLLDKKKPGKLQELANRHYSFNSTKRKHVHLNTDGVGMRWPWKLSDTIYLEANLSAWSCIRFIDNLISEFGFDRSQFSFNIVSEESDESIENEE